MGRLRSERVNEPRDWGEKKLASTVKKKKVLLLEGLKMTIGAVGTHTDSYTPVVIILPHVRVIASKEEVNDRIF